MSSFRSLSLSRMCLAVLFVVSQGLAQGGAIPSTPSNAGTPAAAAALPWKILAKPMGTLASSHASEAIAAMGNPNNWDCKKDPGHCTPQRVADLVKETIGADISRAPTYVVIHWVDYGSANGLSDGWYVHHSRDSKWTYQKFTSQRIYGSPTVLFLFVHLNVTSANVTAVESAMKAAATSSDPALADLAKALASETAGSTRDAKASSLVELARLGDSTIRVPLSSDPSKLAQVRVCAKDSLAPMRFVGEEAVPDAQANVHYESAVVKRTPANVANFLNILKLLGLAHAELKCLGVDTATTALWGAGQIANIGLPSDVTIAGYRIAEKPKEEERTNLQLGSTGAFNDEQLYWWDASIGLPVHKIRDLNYSISDDTVVASQVDKQSAYALFNLMTYPVDLSDPKSNLVPRLLVGFPLSSNPWDRLFAGAGVGLPIKQLRYFQFFAGATFNRSKQPQTLQAGDPANNGQLQNDLKIKMTPKFTFGINVPVKSVFDQLMR